LLYDGENSHQIVHVGLCQAYVLRALKHSGRPVLPGGVQAEVATLADKHGVTYNRQTFRQRDDLFVGENEGLGPSPPNGAEFHQELIIACRVVTDRHVLGLVYVDEEYAT